MAGFWKKMPTLCGQKLQQGILQCQQWADQGSAQCGRWADEGSYQCGRYADEGHQACSDWATNWHKNCCDWAPCSWFCDAFVWIAEQVCHGWYWIANWVCKAWYWLARWVCKAWYWVARWVCLAWQYISWFVCISNFNGGTMFLLTDGTIMLNENASNYGTRRWWKLTPDINGDYFNGTWSRLADSFNARKYYASSVLADGRLLICGGEYSDVSGSQTSDETNRCEIYNPSTNSWSSITPPTGSVWAQIGDGACTLLADGRFLLGNALNNQTTIWNPATATWSASETKNDGTSEESWALLPDGSVIAPQCQAAPGSEKYIPAPIGTAGNWMKDSNVTVNLVETASLEIGPGIVLNDGRAFFIGATNQTALYTAPAIRTNQGTWKTGPTIPSMGKQMLGIKDGPGCLLPSGNVLFGASPVDGQQNSYLSPIYFFEFDGTNINRTVDPPTNDAAVYQSRMLLIPTGEVLFAREDKSDIYGYKEETAKISDAWRPVLDNCPDVIKRGDTISLAGKQFNGLSQAVGYGDDAWAPTNYPLVRIVNNKTNHVRYCRTHDHSTTDSKGNSIPSMGIATGNKSIKTLVDIPYDIELGESTLYVVANSIPSKPCPVYITDENKGLKQDVAEG
jgi:Kelch motif